MDLLTNILVLKNLTPMEMLFWLIAAAGLGAFHALSPGHGKAIVASYLIGSRSTPGHALLLGLVVTLTHTSSVFLLGLATLFASKYVLPERLYPWLSVVSALIVLQIGLGLLVARICALGHSHDHDHDHGHDHPAESDAIHFKSLIGLGISGGLLPCPSALVVMLAAITLGKIAFGLVLIVAFSAGLATVLSLVGLLMIYARRWMATSPLSTTMTRLAPVFSAGVITLIGAVLFVLSLSAALR